MGRKYNGQNGKRLINKVAKKSQGGAVKNNTQSEAIQKLTELIWKGGELLHCEYPNQYKEQLRDQIRDAQARVLRVSESKINKIQDACKDLASAIDEVEKLLILLNAVIEGKELIAERNNYHNICRIDLEEKVRDTERNIEYGYCDFKAFTNELQILMKRLVIYPKFPDEKEKGRTAEISLHGYSEWYSKVLSQTIRKTGNSGESWTYDAPRVIEDKEGNIWHISGAYYYENSVAANSNFRKKCFSPDNCLKMDFRSDTLGAYLVVEYELESGTIPEIPSEGEWRKAGFSSELN